MVTSAMIGQRKVRLALINQSWPPHVLIAQSMVTSAMFGQRKATHALNNQNSPSHVLIRQIIVKKLCHDWSEEVNTCPD
jgi:hypothetical protein